MCANQILDPNVCQLSLQAQLYPHTEYIQYGEVGLIGFAVLDVLSGCVVLEGGLSVGFRMKTFGGACLGSGFVLDELELLGETLDIEVAEV